jgi:serine/threonine-protein kinase
VAQEWDVVAAALPAYEVGGEIGRGAWGVVLEGRHRRLEREVAIKQLPPSFAADPEVRERFAREARLLASLDHPHIVPVYDYVEEEGLCLLVMERLGGGTLWSRSRGGTIRMDDACALILSVCAGLEHAHRAGVLHRDVKPENIMFAGSGVPKVTDFGIAKVLSGRQTMATRSGFVLGTPAYMAPEQAMGNDIGPHSDLYSAALMLYELLAGRLPFPDESGLLATLYRRVHEPPLDLREANAEVPPAVASVIMQALERQPADRFHGAEAFGVALAEAGGRAWGPGWLRRASFPVLAAGSIVAAAEVPVRPASSEKAAAIPAAQGAPRRKAEAGDVAPDELVPVRLAAAPPNYAFRVGRPSEVCPGCFAALAAGETSCSSCGASVKRCGSCAGTMLPDDLFCGHCGAAWRGQ